MPADITKVVECLRRSALRHEEAELSDGQLLGRFLEDRDQAAVTALVKRHGPMVWGVCRRVLGNHHDAEDAFQATFLVLVHKARSIKHRQLLGNWLYGVAHHTALKARAMLAKRRATQRQVTDVPDSGQPLEDTWRELQPLLDQELSLLPEKYRTAIVLCDLQGTTRKKAAHMLGLAEGTLAGRLARGRALVARRLARSGALPGAGTVATFLAASSASAEVPASAMAATIKAVSLLAAGRAGSGQISANVAALTRGVLEAMFLDKLKPIAVVLLLAVMAAVGGALSMYPMADAQPTPVVTRQPLALVGQPARATDPDTDGDGLADFHEVHKYKTDPNKKDTAGKGVPDGDWQQRREFTYSVRAIVRVMPPYNLKELHDDYQDVRVLKETPEFAELEVILYPLNTNAQAITANPHWKKDVAGMKEYLQPGITTNWDDAMRDNLLRELAKDGIDPDKLTDREVVEQVSRWLFKRSQHREMFCTFYVGFTDGKPVILPGLEKAFDRDKGNAQWTVQQQLERELLGKQMFAHKTYGTCTSAAVYQTTVLRALDIPTRMILCIPLADGSDPTQVEMIDKGLTHQRIRCDACLGALSGGSGFASHTFCEVFVGGRWRRLNYTTLGQNILERNYLGLMIHVHTFNDLSEANLAATWGKRYALGQRDKLFPHSNPYRLMEVSDHFGQYAQVPNPPAPQELKQVTIDRAYWADAKEAPEEIRKLEEKRVRELMELGGADGLLSETLRGDRRFEIHCQEWLEDAGDYLQYKLFMRRADPNFVLRAKGQPDVACQLSMSFVTHVSRKLCELEVVIPSAQYSKMAAGVAYTLHPVNGKKEHVWKVREGVTLLR
jgi:RNA polymerase sigma factor (sigma-70 family)